MMSTETIPSLSLFLSQPFNDKLATHTIPKKQSCFLRLFFCVLGFWVSAYL